MCVHECVCVCSGGSCFCLFSMLSFAMCVGDALLMSLCFLCQCLLQFKRHTKKCLYFGDKTRALSLYQNAVRKFDEQ